MTQNIISASLPAADKTAVLTAVTTIKQKLPFLKDLAPWERRNLPKMGDKSLAFVQAALGVANANPDFLPQSFDLAEFGRDVALWNDLQPVALAINQLNELVDDTVLAVSSDAYMAALLVYQAAKMAGEGAGLDGQLDALGQRFAHKARIAQPAAKPS